VNKSSKDVLNNKLKSNTSWCLPKFHKESDHFKI